MKEISIIIQTSTRGSDWIQEIHKVAYPSRKRALNAILETYNEMLKNGDDPGRDARTVPEIILDKEKTSHNGSVLKFKDPDAEGLCRIEIWDPTTCPESLQDDPTLSEWHERFDIETVTLAPEDDDNGPFTINETREYINAAIRRLGQFMWDDKDGCPKPDILLPEPITIMRILDGRGYLDFTEFTVTAIVAGRDDIPMVKGFWQGEEKEECIDLRCHYTQNGHFYEDSFWNIDNLVEAVITE